MWPSTQDWGLALSIIVPTYCANGAPVLFGGGPALDFGRSFPDGERVLGDNKTIRGFLFGIMIGVVVGVFGYYLFSKDLLLMATLASVGALLGDLGGAFLKRRLRIMPGGALPIVDQLDFVVGALLMVSPFFGITLGAMVIIFFVTPPIHFLTNVGAHLLGLKSTYW